MTPPSAMHLFGSSDPQFIWTLRREGTQTHPIRYDEATDMVVIARTSQEARKVAASAARDEGPEVWLNGRRSGLPFARIKKIGVALKNDNGSVKRSQVVVCDGSWSG